jgi:hypothetical protein
MLKWKKEDIMLKKRKKWRLKWTVIVAFSLCIYELCLLVMEMYKWRGFVQATQMVKRITVAPLSPFDHCSWPKNQLHSCPIDLGGDGFRPPATPMIVAIIAISTSKRASALRPSFLAQIPNLGQLRWCELLQRAANLLVQKLGQAFRWG